MGLLWLSNTRTHTLLYAGDMVTPQLGTDWHMGEQDIQREGEGGRERGRERGIGRKREGGREGEGCTMSLL